jgi:hypothetical protein
MEPFKLLVLYGAGEGENIKPHFEDNNTVIVNHRRVDDALGALRDAYKSDQPFDGIHLQRVRATEVLAVLREIDKFSTKDGYQYPAPNSIMVVDPINPEILEQRHNPGLHAACSIITPSTPLLPKARQIARSVFKNLTA